MKLSIIVITMNRAEQLREALISCFRCKLPEHTEFIIIDNASTDNTDETVKHVFAKYNYPYKYIKEIENRGVGGGRNIGFYHSSGEYCYFLDDDAIISPECYDTFFIDTLKYFDKDKKISSITTRIYDEAWKSDRLVNPKSSSKCTLPIIFMYCGGSHFLRKQYYNQPLYINIKYGHEELIPSLYTIDKCLYNCYINNIKIIHKPKINKWISNTEINYDISCRVDANIFASKTLLYPNIFLPMLYLSFIIRLFKHFGLKFNWHKESWRRYFDLISNNQMKKIRFCTIFKIIKYFKLGSAF